MNRSAVTLKIEASFFACSLLMERLPLRTSETRPRAPNTGSRSLAFRPLVSIKGSCPKSVIGVEGLSIQGVPVRGVLRSTLMRHPSGAWLGGQAKVPDLTPLGHLPRKELRWNRGLRKNHDQ